MRAAYVPPVITPYSLDDLAYALRTGLTARLGSRARDEVVAVAMAKCRLETGNGQHVWNHNLGNVKCAAETPGNFTCIVLNECEQRDGKGVVVWYAPEGELVGGRGSPLRNTPLEVPDGHPQTRMQARANVTDAGYFYVDFIFGNTRYKAAQDGLLAGSPEAYVRGLKQGGYFTAPLDQYLGTVLSLYQPSLAFLRGHVSEQPVVPSRDEWHDGLLLKGFVDVAYNQIREDGPHGARDAIEDEA